MALLAEQKRKTKFGLDPRNTSWSNDSSKFGQRLMEKMGWEKGKGLGAHEDGITEHIKATYKSDSRGLGCTSQDADAWIAHQDDFNDLLKVLNSQSEANSQEEKAAQTKQTKHVDGHRRYYGRFSRGQVQTLRSTDDLDCIFGKRKRTPKTAEPDEQPETKLDCSDDKEEKRHGLTTVTSTSSVQEYFAQKMAEMKARKEANTRENSDPIQGRKDSVDCEDKEERKSPVYSAFSFIYNDHEMKEVSSSAGVDGAAVERTCRGWYPDFSNTSSNIQDIEVKKKSSKKKKQKKVKSDNEDNDCDVEIIMSNSKKSKTKKECKERMLDDSITINSHASLESSELPSTSKIEEKKQSKKNKDKTKKECKEKIPDDSVTKNSHSSLESSELPSTSKLEEKKESKKNKDKTRKECKEKMLDDSVTINCHASLESFELPSTSKIEEKKQSKKNKDKTKKEYKEKMPEDSVTINSHASLESSELPSTGKIEEKKQSKKNKDNVTIAPCEEKKQSKKKKIKENETVIVTESTCDSASNIDDGSEDKNKQKKKRKTCNEGETVDNNHNNCALDEINIKMKTTNASSLKHPSEGSVVYNSETNGDAANEQERENTCCDGRKKKSKKRKHCEKYSDEECPVESKHDNDDDAVKKKKRRKDGHTSEPDKETRDDSQDNADSATAKHKSNTSNADNQNIANITESSEQPDDKINEKKRRKKKKKAKPVKDQCTKSKAFFPGSNIAEIVGYALK